MPDNRRSGTRVKCQMSVALHLVDTIPSPPRRGMILVVNPRGCAAQVNHPIEVGARVRLEGLPGKNTVTALVVNCTSPGHAATFWLLGLALDEPGNVWGIGNPPEDWRT